MRVLHIDNVENKELSIILNWMILNDEREIEYNLRPGLLRQNCNWFRGWCGSRSVNVQFDINLANSVTTGRV